MKTMLAEPEADDDRLVRLARAGDRSAFAALVERHYEFIYRVAWRWSASRPEAEDVAQEVCIRLAGAIGGFRGEGRFTTWLYALTLNAARDQQRCMPWNLILAARRSRRRSVPKHCGRR
jgi:RNA polymerase sigma-70 factor, ECF subfamily